MVIYIYAFNLSVFLREYIVIFLFFLEFRPFLIIINISNVFFLLLRVKTHDV